MVIPSSQVLPKGSTSLLGAKKSSLAQLCFLLLNRIFGFTSVVQSPD